jgi:hypothetical protein
MRGIMVMLMAMMRMMLATVVLMGFHWFFMWAGVPGCISLWFSVSTEENHRNRFSEKKMKRRTES